jgi:hypothetical protein
MKAKLVIAVLMVTMLLVYGAVIGDMVKKGGSVTKQETESITETQEPTQQLTSQKAGEQIDWQVISSGGTDGNSASYSLKGTVGQTGATDGESASYKLAGGFWQDFSTSGVTCVPGDANESGGVDIDDVVYLIAYIFSGGPPPVPDVCCGDANGSGGVDIDDVVYLIAYIFSGGPAPVDGC